MSRTGLFLVGALRAMGILLMLIGIAESFAGDADAIPKAAVMMTMCTVLVMDLERGERRWN